MYLEPWHPDIEEFLELRDSTGEDARRAHNLNLANWVPDEFMRRVEADQLWSLIDPDAVPGLPGSLLCSTSRHDHGSRASFPVYRSMPAGSHPRWRFPI